MSGKIPAHHRRFSIDLPEDLAEALRRAAMADNRTYRSAAAAAIEDWCEAHGTYVRPPIIPVQAIPLEHRTHRRWIETHPGPEVIPETIPAPPGDSW